MVSMPMRSNVKLRRVGEEASEEVIVPDIGRCLPLGPDLEAGPHVVPHVAVNSVEEERDPTNPTF
jgi:hypothetical protein